jgi:hypothetical protein
MWNTWLRYALFIYTPCVASITLSLKTVDFKDPVNGTNFDATSACLAVAYGIFLLCVTLFMFYFALKKSQNLDTWGEKKFRTLT